MIDLHTGDCREVLKQFDACSFDACVTDPPYHLTQNSRGGHARTNNPEMPHGRHRIGDKGFMGKIWDGGDVAFDPATWREVFRVLKPGAHLIAFGGTRTYHRMVCAIEDAGFEIRDCIMWVYGSGFPKSLDVSKAIDKAAGAQREVVGIKSGHEEFAERTTKGHVDFKGATEGFDRPWMHDDVKRAAYHMQTAAATDAAKQWEGWGTALKPALEPIVLARKPLDGTVAENVCRHGTGALNIDGCRIATDDVIHAVQSDPSKRGSHAGEYCLSTRDKDAMHAAQRASVEKTMTQGRWPANIVTDGSDEVVALFPDDRPSGGHISRRTAPKSKNAFGDLGCPAEEVVGYPDSGSAARFFYTAKVSQSERGRDNTHPTVKPLDLMRYLCKLVTPPGGLILDPFIGSGSTAIAAAQLDMHAVCIDLEAEHVEIAANRIRDTLGMLAELRRHERAA